MAAQGEHSHLLPAVHHRRDTRFPRNGKKLYEPGGGIVYHLGVLAQYHHLTFRIGELDHFVEAGIKLGRQRQFQQHLIGTLLGEG